MVNCKLIIQDEVNIKLEGLPVDIRRKVVSKLKYDVPYARHMPQYKLGRWDGKVGFFGTGGNGYLNHLDVILKVLEDNRVSVSDIVDQRIPISLNLTPVTETYWADQGVRWPKGHPSEGELIMLRDYQVEAVNNFIKNPQSLQQIATGAGKCQPYDSKVLTPSGWTTMGEIAPGDKVVTPSGKIANVLEVYEPGIKDVYEIRFADGRTAKSCEDHIWPIYNVNWRRNTKKGGPVRNISLKEIIKLKNKTKRSIGILLARLDNDDRDIDLPIDPWLLGFLLGDGSFRNGKLCFSSADQELVDKVRSKISSDYEVKHISNYDYCIKFKNKELQQKKHSELISKKTRNKKGHIVSGLKESSNFYINSLTKLKLMETYSYNKFIPEIYFNGSYQQRIELIRGLVDSDGTIDKKSIKFTSVSKELAIGFNRLIHSIGGISKILPKTNNYYMYKGKQKSCKDSYTVSTKFHKPWMLTSLSRKKNLCGSSYQYGPTLKLNIESITKVGREPVKCIMIDDPKHLYLTDDYIVTHNTITTATLSHISEPYGRSIVIVPNKSLVEQTEEDYRNCGLDVGVYFGDRKELGKTHTICTWQSLNILDKKHKNGEEVLSLAEFLEDVNAVIVDEVHQAKADVLKNLLTRNLRNAPIRWGLTGTIPKADYEFQSILASLGPVVGEVTAKELQDKGVLANCHVNICQLIDTHAYNSYQEELKYLTTNDDRLTYIAKMLNKVSQSGNTLILVDRISAGEKLQELIPDSVFVKGDVKLKDRKEAYDEINQGTNHVVIATYGVAAVGINIPRIFNLVLFEPGKSFVRVIQSIGRGVRKAKDKDFVQIWDITSTSKYAKKHLTERKKFYKEASYPFTIEKIDWNK